eukprot:COSAG01_NODE_539_length_15749_cov_21.448307_2_plen_241_part_00
MPGQQPGAPLNGSGAAAPGSSIINGPAVASAELARLAGAGRRQRRRRLVAGAALAVVFLVAGIVGAVLIVTGGGEDGEKTPTATPTPPAGPPCEALHCNLHGACRLNSDGSFRTCACDAGFGGTHCEINTDCPAGGTRAPGARYCSDLVGACRGPGGSDDHVNDKYKSGVTRPACQAECDAAPACTGYTYEASVGYCCVYGPGLDTDLGGGWYGSTDPTTTIGGTDGGSAYVCAAVAGRN